MGGRRGEGVLKPGDFEGAFWTLKGMGEGCSSSAPLPSPCSSSPPYESSSSWR